MELLRNISFLKDLSTGELIKINLLTEDVSFKKGEEIIREGSACDALYVVKSGSVRIMKGGSHLETVKAGEALNLSLTMSSSRTGTQTIFSDRSSLKETVNQKNHCGGM